MASNVENCDVGFSGPLTLEEIRKHLSIKKLPKEINKRATIEVSQPSRTIYDESPEVDLLIRMELKDEEDDSELHPDFVNYLHRSREPRCSKVEEPANFIEQLSKVLEVDDSIDNEQDSGVKSDDSLVIISDGETSFNCCTFTPANIKSELESSEEKPQVSGLNNSIIYIDDEDELPEVPVLECKNNISVLIEEADKYEDTTSPKENISLEPEGSNTSALIERCEESRHSQKFNNYSYDEPNNTVDYRSEQSFTSAKSFDSDEHAESMFNDTLEEVKMALKYGLDYTMEDDDDNGNMSSSSPVLQRQTSPTVIHDTPRPKSNEKPQPKDFQFKQPLIRQIPVRIKTPNYKNVVSPVAVYIRNSPKCPILRNVQPPNTFEKKRLFPNPETAVTNECNKENVLKAVVYKPPRQVIKESAPSLKLPANIKMLLPQTPNVIKHHGRVGKKQDALIQEKLLSEDTSVIDSSQLDSTVPLEEISVHYSKDAYIL